MAAMHRLLPVKKRVRNANEALAMLKDIGPAREYILAKQRPGVCSRHRQRRGYATA